MHLFAGLLHAPSHVSSVYVTGQPLPTGLAYTLQVPCGEQAYCVPVGVGVGTPPMGVGVGVGAGGVMPGASTFVPDAMP